MALEFVNKNCKYETLLAIEDFMKKVKIEHYQVVIFGAGCQGNAMLKKLKNNGIEALFFADNNVLLHGKKFLGIECIPPNDILKIEKAVILVASAYMDDIIMQLEKMQIDNVYCFGQIMMDIEKVDLEKTVKDKIKLLQAMDLLEDEYSKRVYEFAVRQWFDAKLSFPHELISEEGMFHHGIWDLKENEIYVDCGAYNGDTIEEFIKEANAKFKKIYAFELDQDNYTELQRNVKKLPEQGQIFCYNQGVGNNSGVIAYSGKQDVAHISQDGERRGTICKLDQYVENATLIKMDIEGFELEALMGAEMLIKVHHPKLMICLYHKLSDYYEIPLYIKRIVPNYRFYIRHYTAVETETILYAFV